MPACATLTQRLSKQNIKKQNQNKKIWMKKAGRSLGLILIEENWQESKQFWRETVQNEIDILSSRPVVHIDSVVENPIFEFGIESYQTTRTACLEPVFPKSLVIWLQLNRWQRLKYGKMKMLTREPEVFLNFVLNQQKKNHVKWKLKPWFHVSFLTLFYFTLLYLLTLLCKNARKVNFQRPRLQ